MKVVACDTETRGLGWFNDDERAFLATWSDDTGDHAAWENEPERLEQMFRALRQADVIVMHNASFDVHQIRATWGEDLLTYPGTIVDTDVLARVVVPERRTRSDEDLAGSSGFKLKDLGLTYVDRSAKDTEDDIARLAKEAGIKLKSKGGYYDTARAYPEAMEAYAKNDTRLTIQLYEKLIAKVGDRHRRIWELERSVQPHLIRAEARGVRVDPEKVAPLQVQYTAERDRTFAAVNDVLGPVLGDPEDPEDKDDHAALRDALLEQGVPLYRKVKSCKHGDASCDCALATNKFALKEFEKDYPVITDLFEFRKAAKFLATYINPMVDREVVHTSFWQIGAWTGRMSSSRPNMQNLPARGEGSSELRAMFIPREGHCFVVSDFDAIEARLLAYYLGSKGQQYRELIAAGHDVHAWMASMIWGGTPQEYAKGGPKDKLRSLAKNVLFAIVYGAGAPRVMDMLADAGMQSTRDAAKSLISTIKASVPGYWSLAKRVRTKVETVGHVNTIMGRKQPVSRDKGYVGLNAVIQGSAADVFKQSIINVGEAVAHLGALPILFVHDEQVVECPIEHAEECRRLQDRAMSEALDLDPELLVSSAICMSNYAEAK